MTDSKNKHMPLASASCLFAKILFENQRKNKNILNIDKLFHAYFILNFYLHRKHSKKIRPTLAAKEYENKEEIIPLHEAH